MIFLRLLGPIEIISNGATVRLDSRKALALLVYLVVSAKPVSRSALLGLLWADMPEARGRANLSWTLNRLGTLLPGAIEASRGSVRFVRSNITVDLDQFQQLATASEPQQRQAAIELYIGSLADGLVMSGCPEFEHWLLIERERLEQQLIALLQRHADSLAAQGTYAQAAEILARLLAFDPLNEPAFRQRMQLLAVTGQRTTALALFDTSRRLLLDELGLEVESETTALAAAIRRGQFERTGVSPLSNTSFLQYPASPLIGRERERTEVTTMLVDSACRMVTIVGFGGMGKTRLALACVEQAANHFRDGVCIVSLAAIDTVAVLATTIAEALALNLQSHATPELGLLAALRDRQQLLLLDNMEHLLDGAELLASMLAVAPNITLLVTSQERLGLRDEWVYDIRGLYVPNSNDDSATIDQSDAVRLFVQHARKAQASFVLDATNRNAVVRICRALWGHPMAIEGAASWVRTLSCAEIASEIEAGAGLLTTAAPDIPARHRSAQSVFAYSWARLSETEQHAFALLSIFPGDFGRDPAGAVLAPCINPQQAALHLLGTLVEKSLLRRFRNGRFMLHKLLRGFAAANLSEAEASAAHERLWHFYARWLQLHQHALRGANQASALAGMSAELPALRASWFWAADHADSAMAGALDSLLLLYDNRGWFRAGADFFAETAMRLQAAGAPSALVGRVRTREGFLLLWLGQYQAAQHAFNQNLDRPVDRGDVSEHVLNLAGHSFTLRWLGDLATAERQAREAETLARSLGDQWLTATALQYLALILRDRGMLAEARMAALECRALFQSFGYQRGIGFALTVLGLVAQDQGHVGEASRWFHEGYDLCAAIPDPLGVVIAEQYLGRLAFLQNRLAEARERVQRALEASQSLGYAWGVVRAQTLLGVIAHAAGEQQDAETLLTAALVAARALSVQTLIHEAATQLQRVQAQT